MIGFRIQVGRTYVAVRWPWEWEWQTSLMYPKLYGFGIFIERRPLLALDTEGERGS